MVKYKIEKVFKDIHTKDVYKADQIVDMTVKRAKEVESNLDSSYLSRVEDKEK
ncbi:hypothetical protein [Rummeliibacillus suwonensis]|uniref:hypothetical protein n=1 Tax=Rummeliibacillus suwonensis TaxID=1306154 RepID=UPI0016483978|nr:hypothetical protein [Rummeliibacillus suwonensis]